MDLLHVSSGGRFLLSEVTLYGNNGVSLMTHILTTVSHDLIDQGGT